MKGIGYLEIAVNKIVRQEVREVLGKIRAEIKTKRDSIPWLDYDYDYGWDEALDFADNVIDKYMAEYKEYEEA